MTVKSYYLTILSTLGYDVALASLKMRLSLTWEQAIKLASDYGGGGVV